MSYLDFEKLIEDKLPIVINNNENHYEKNNISIKGLRKKSYLRGDFYYENDNLFIIDCKNYAKAQQRMKPSSLVLKNKDLYIKTSDSNLKAFFENNLFYQIENYKEIKEHFYNKSQKKIKGKMSSELFKELVHYFEYGYSSLINKNIYKYFISKLSSQIRVSFLNIDFRSDIIVKSSYEKGYFYLQFFDQNNLVYELSARKDKRANCVFIHKDLLISKVINPNNLNSFFNKVFTKKIHFKNFQNEAIQLILENKKLQSHEIANFLYYKQYNDLKLWNPYLDKNKIIKFLLKNLNPQFKRKCQCFNIDYKNKKYIFNK